MPEPDRRFLAHIAKADFGAMLRPGMQRDFLPVAERELRAAARRKVTFRLRWALASLGFLASFIWFTTTPVARLPGKFIGSLFSIQTTCAFLFALLAGPFLTADSLSEERRDGTLGLLFLTPMRGGGIVLGKFAGTSVNAIYGLLALVPVTAAPLLLGGVSLAEFCRTALALVNALFFSLAIGLSVSAFVVDYSRGVAGTLGLLALFGGVFPLVAAFGPMLTKALPWGVFACLSPSYPFVRGRDLIYAMAPGQYWWPLCVSHVLGWICLALAGMRLNRSWRDKDTAPKTAAPQELRTRRARKRESKPGASFTEEVFDPMSRLVGAAPFVRSAVWFIVLAWAAVVWANHVWTVPVLREPFAAKFFAFTLKALAAFQACRFFVELRRSGALELLFCTPLKNADLINTQWRALLKVFLWPLLVFLLLAWMNTIYLSNHRPPGLPRMPPSLDDLSGLKPGFLGASLLSLELGADILALGWFGMWAALRLAKPGLAPALTIAAVLVIPSMFSSFDLVADMLFISWGTTRLRDEFRWQAVMSLTRVNAPA